MCVPCWPVEIALTASPFRVSTMVSDSAALGGGQDPPVGQPDDAVRPLDWAQDRSSAASSRVRDVENVDRAARHKRPPPPAARPARSRSRAASARSPRGRARARVARSTKESVFSPLLPIRRMPVTPARRARAAAARSARRPRTRKRRVRSSTSFFLAPHKPGDASLSDAQGKRSILRITILQGSPRDVITHV